MASTVQTSDTQNTVQNQEDTITVESSEEAYEVLEELQEEDLRVRFGDKRHSYVDLEFREREYGGDQVKVKAGGITYTVTKGTSGTICKPSMGINHRWEEMEIEVIN